MNYDYIVVGAGSAGAILATRLTEDPKVSVLLLEAGPDYPDLESLPDEVRIGLSTGADIITKDHNWQFWGNPSDRALPMPVPRGRVIGGSSSINGQVFLRGMPEDYDTWQEMGNTEWSYEKVLPYFRKLETDLDYSGDFHGSDGPIIARRHKREDWIESQRAFYNACKDAGFPDGPDQNHPDVTGVGPTPFNNPNGIRWSTNLGYLSMARHRLNLTIRAQCTSRKVLFEGNKAIGMEVESEGESFNVYGDTIILSAGAVASPQLLMLSGVGPADQLKALGINLVNDLPGVGQNLRDHPIMAALWSVKESHIQDPDAPRSQVAARYTAAGSDLRNDVKLAFNSFAIADSRIEHRKDSAPAGHEADINTPVGVKISVSLQLAESAGYMRLVSNDIHEQPELNFNYYSTEFDLKRGREGLLKAISLGESRYFANILDKRLQPSDDHIANEDSLNDWILRNATTGQHISGTCKMGPDSDELAVVNQSGDVRGLENLKVIDASIMPDCIRANTNATTMMIAERMLDLI
ncbi:MAG: mycofactocin system GMC family oxidoreductase MftG [SAR202 cluster bacterium]|jgi:choline dehydrogenase|nr:MAG: mycofactocin system GMC family oxidoreductase MftG [SAR202 cluster bacterium]KAA1303342.1 MAG: mycofactocin system GMC family oxidoreductase MftG [SAR202 cluster bacterium]MEC8912714.1 GMC family oxidoreductase N-terminal domain-containing protein [Chloroflexota bacterium]|tara:strand:+ start:2816 stop:4384 length:1569 start_codon:yes stop_codon:yes gene_type:complete